MMDDEMRVDFTLIKAAAIVAAMIATGSSFCATFAAAYAYEWVGNAAATAAGGLVWVCIFSASFVCMVWAIEKTMYPVGPPPPHEGGDREIPLHQREKTSMINMGRRGGGG